MSCKACGKDGGLEVCLNCGHTFCSMHLGESGGAATCTPCLKEEAGARARRRAQQEKQAAAKKQAVGTPVGEPVEVAPKVAPLPEPKSNLQPILIGLVVAAPAAIYLWWLGGTLGDDSAWPAWGRIALCAGGSLFAFAGVWAIAKSR